MGGGRLSFPFSVNQPYLSFTLLARDTPKQSLMAVCACADIVFTVLKSMWTIEEIEKMKLPQLQEVAAKMEIPAIVI